MADLVADRSADDVAVVPAHWFAEVANGLLAGERRQRTRADRIAAFRKRLSALPLDVDQANQNAALDIYLPLARAHHLTIYDAAYLELAERRGLAIATLDRKLATAARNVGLAIVGS